MVSIDAGNALASSLRSRSASYGTSPRRLCTRLLLVSLVVGLVQGPLRGSAQSNVSPGTWTYTNPNAWEELDPSCSSADGRPQSPIAITTRSLRRSEQEIFLQLASIGRTNTYQLVDDPSFPSLTVRPDTTTTLLLLSTHYREELLLKFGTVHRPLQHQHPHRTDALAEMTLYFESRTPPQASAGGSSSGATGTTSADGKKYLALSFFIASVPADTPPASTGSTGGANASANAAPPILPNAFVEKMLNKWQANASLEWTSLDLQSLPLRELYEYVGSRPFPPCNPMRWYIATEMVYATLDNINKVKDKTNRPLQPRFLRSVRVQAVREAQRFEVFPELQFPANMTNRGNDGSLEDGAQPASGVRAEYIASVTVLGAFVAVLLGVCVFLVLYDVAAMRVTRVHPSIGTGMDFTTINDDGEYEEGSRDVEDKSTSTVEKPSTNLPADASRVARRLHAISK